MIGWAEENWTRVGRQSVSPKGKFHKALKNASIKVSLQPLLKNAS